MKQRTTQILYSYWNEVRGTRIAPRRFEIEPARIASILPETFILERNSASVFQFRLAGTRICEYLGYELRHRNLLEVLPLAERHVLEHDLTAVSDRGAVALCEFETTTRDGRSGRCEMLILPLTDGQDAITRFVGAMCNYDMPSSFEASPLSMRGLIKHELIWPDGRPHAAAAPRSAPLQRPMAARVVISERRQFLVFDGGRSDTEPCGG